MTVHAPKRGSRLNMAEIEFSVLSRAGLPGRIPTIKQLRREVSRRVATRDKSRKGIVWRLTTENAKVKPASLYSKFSWLGIRFCLIFFEAPLYYEKQ